MKHEGRLDAMGTTKAVIKMRRVRLGRQRLLRGRLRRGREPLLVKRADLIIAEVGGRPRENEDRCDARDPMKCCRSEHSFDYSTWSVPYRAATQGPDSRHLLWTRVTSLITSSPHGISEGGDIEVVAPFLDLALFHLKDADDREVHGLVARAGPVDALDHYQVP